MSWLLLFLACNNVKQPVPEDSGGGGDSADRHTGAVDTASVHTGSVDTGSVDSVESGGGDTGDTGGAPGWTEAERVVVIYNPLVGGSETVALAYADFRGLSDTQLCAVATSETETLAGADYEAFVETVMDCVAAQAPEIWYLVPVYGVPFKVSDRIGDLAYGTPTTTSLDALLVFGEDGPGYERVFTNPYWARGDSLAGVYDEAEPFGDFQEGRSKDYFLVSRIEGADAYAALGLIERTRAAEALAAAGELDGLVYVDGQYGDTPPSTDDWGSYESGEWDMWGTATIFEGLGWYEVVWDGNGTEFGTEPSLTECPDALYYAGWYSFYHYNDCFTWNPGAIGGHLDSCSACDIRGGSSWVSGALDDGITATFGAVNEPYVAGMPSYDQLFLYLTQGYTFGEAAYQSTKVAAWMMVWVGDPLYRPYPSP